MRVGKQLWLAFQGAFLSVLLANLVLYGTVVQELIAGSVELVWTFT